LKPLVFAIPIITILLGGSIATPLASAQFQGGGVDHPGTWYVGEGLKPGDYFEYKLCHVDYEDCTEFEMDIWIEGDITVGSESKWLAQVVVYDGNKIVKGNMELGKVAPEPSGGSIELGPYRGAFKSSIVWLSAYATADIGVHTEGAKAFSDPSWGKIANIGGEQIIPTALETITVPAGTSDTILVQWKTGGAESKVWVVDDFPFPIKASTWVQVTTGIPPQEYRFELLDYEENVNSNPFSNVTPTPPDASIEGCTQHYDLVDVKRTTSDATYLINLKYGPPDPATGCPIEWFLDFKNKFHETEYLNQVQYDILVVDDNLTPLRSIAQEEGHNFLYSQGGQVYKSTIVKESPGTAHYVIWVYGLAPKHVVPTGNPDYLQIDIPIGGKVTPPPGPSLNIPDWIKNNAGWWATDQIADSDFVSGIQYLINQGIMKIPPTTPGSGTESDEIPSWIKNNAGWWANNQISDTDFVSGIQYLIENGIMKLA
jgi:hypothetical protein